MFKFKQRYFKDGGPKYNRLLFVACPITKKNESNICHYSKFLVEIIPVNVLLSNYDLSNSGE